MRGLFYKLRPFTEVTPIKKKLKPKEKLFCAYFVCLGDAGEAAERAGYGGDRIMAGNRMLCEEKILNEIERLTSARKGALAGLASAGYYRLAFGGITDALRLLYMDDPAPEQLKGMDLFLISEIKKPKEGMLEIKFFDRLKALEKLETSGGESEGVSGLYEAIGRGAQSGGMRSD